MSDYVQQQWQSQNALAHGQRRLPKILAWSAGGLAVIAFVAYAFHDKWYPLVQPYLHS